MYKYQKIRYLCHTRRHKLRIPGPGSYAAFSDALTVDLASSDHVYSINLMSKAVDAAKLASRSAGALQGLLGNNVPRVLKDGKLNLYETLSRLPRSGEGALVHQARWTKKGISDCYWKITRSQTKNEGSSGKAWGILFWRGE
jgi:hypothetical protein